MPPGDLQTDRPHSARIYDYLLGGKDNFEADRRVAEEILKHTPALPISMRANRRFMAKVVGFLADRGIRQFLDVGTGLPTSPNLHEVVQRMVPEATVVYVDNDPLVLSHARALLTPVGTGAVSYLDADLRQPESILRDDAVVKGFDLTRPVALTIIAVLQHVIDDDQARAIIGQLMAPLPAGSALALSAVTVENDPAGAGTVRTYNQNGVPVIARTREGVEALFSGFDLVEPGVVPVHHWKPVAADKGVDDAAVYMYGGVALK
ncbi:SAM-dependent methyltransferase [Actinoplanes sichuanensis]|uniref:SAM-dependent methyltransferase n=1 Tax=Actinoplanes sichuanensis TaxID=512349 RepID=A0ABW4A925_9ACTN|nr:SAM-dependent methyltransferase [Actinoplanes sichuanensis]BEL03679.1 SAM-dependent methyltransferase [Actinoplanes sichuanensis]